MKKNPAVLAAALRSKHIRTLEVLQTVVDENEALKESLAKFKNNNSDADRLAGARADAAEKKLAEAEQKIKGLLAQLEESTDKKVLEERCRQLQAKIERQEVKLKTYEDGKQKLLESIGKKDAEVTSAMAQVHEAVAGKKEAEEAANRLREEIEALKAKALAAAELESKLQSRVADLEQQLEAMRNSLTRSTADTSQIDMLTRESEENKKLLATLRAANKTLTKDLQTAKQSIKVLQEVHDTTVASKDALEAELLNAQQRLAALEQENRQLHEMIKKLQEQLDKIREEEAATPSGSRFGNFVALKKENELLTKKLALYKSRSKKGRR